MRRKAVLVLVLLAGALMVNAQIYKDPKQPVEARVQDLLNRMTSEEKFWQLFMIPLEENPQMEKYKAGIFGFQMNTAGQASEAAGQMLNYASSQTAFQTAEKVNEIQKFLMEETRLGIPMIPFDEALHGLVRPGATAFPQSIALAASFNTALMDKVANSIAMECKVRGIRQILSPVVNIATDVRWGRTEETYGEDPFLTSEMGKTFVRAFEDLDIITTPKHFLANVGDGGRDSYPIHDNERYLREIHLPPFEACFGEGHSRSVMTSYNSLDGSPCTANNWLLNDYLKSELKFDGFVISDAGATGGANVLHFTAKDYADATAKSITNGLDVIFQTSYEHYQLFQPPFLDGTIDSASINRAVARVLKAKFELGLFENPYVELSQPALKQGFPDHKAVALEAALESIVLLKNENQLLPLSRNLKNLAVVGSDAVEARLGGYSGPGNDNVSILDGIKNLVAPETEILYSKGSSRKIEDFTTISSAFLSSETDGKTTAGLRGEYYPNTTFSGVPVFVRTDAQVDFQWTLFSPDPEKLDYDFYGVRWNGKLVSPVSATLKIGLEGNDGFRLFIDNQLIIDQWTKQSFHRTVADFDFKKGQTYQIKIEFYEPTGNARIKLLWNLNQLNLQPQLEEALEIAQKSDVIVVVAGIEEGEFRDRALLSLPGNQEELIHLMAGTGKPVVVVLVGGSAITMNSWINQVDGILMAWYSGEEGGNAVAQVLFGDYNPAGRLPVTFPIFEGQLPLVYNHKPTGRGDDYDNLTGQPLFPFGFGLSYTQFAYSNISLDKNTMSPHDTAILSVDIANVGKIAGDEVVQLYVRDELSSLARPIAELKAFRRIHLDSGQTQKMQFLITPQMLTMLNGQMEKVVENGDFRIMVGSSSKDIRQKIKLKINN